jgi:DNA-binding NtrC family response regulator
VVPIYLPPLRERREDIPPLASFFLTRYSEENRRDPPALTAEVLNVLTVHDWPGNVRELENYIERAVVLSAGGELTADLVRPAGHAELLRIGMRKGGQRGDLHGLIQQLVQMALQTIPAESGELYRRVIKGVERELIEQVLGQSNGVHIKAAERLGINRNTLHKKVEELSRDSPRDADAV